MYGILRPHRAGARARGMSLFELVCAVTLVAVLLSVAVPSYARYRERVRSAQAATDIAAIATRLAQYRLDNRVYPDTLQQAGIAAVEDPWGHPYQYLPIEGHPGKGAVRKDKKLNPINSDFDLYSYGPDGQSKQQLDNKVSRDDVVRASDGAFIGIAADFGS